jgi:hypothetical protein
VLRLLRDMGRTLPYLLHQPVLQELWSAMSARFAMLLCVPGQLRWKNPLEFDWHLLMLSRLSAVMPILDPAMERHPLAGTASARALRASEWNTPMMFWAEGGVLGARGADLAVAQAGGAPPLKGRAVQSALRRAIAERGSCY